MRFHFAMYMYKVRNHNKFSTDNYHISYNQKRLSCYHYIRSTLTVI